MMRPLVAVRLLTYNHEKYISQSIESVLRQQTNFDYKLVIGEDCSTDNTKNICLEYSQNYPNKIILLCNEKNDLLKNSKDNFDACNKTGAKYIALLEGDDYWTDSFKLQKQVDFLEANPDFVACFHNVRIEDSRISGERLVYPIDRKTEISLVDLANGDYMHTCSLLFRNIPRFLYPILHNLVPVDDDSIGFCLLLEGRIAKYMNDVMSIYRKHEGGVWSSLSHLKKLLWTIEHQQASIKYYNDEILSPILKKRLKSSATVLMKIGIRSVNPFLFLKGLKIFILG